MLLARMEGNLVGVTGMCVCEKEQVLYGPVQSKPPPKVLGKSGHAEPPVLVLC